MSRPKLLFVTRSRYWQPGNGEAARTAALVESLAGCCTLTVFLTEPVDAAAQSFVDCCPHRYRLMAGRDPQPSRAALLATMQSLCSEIAPDVVLLSRLQLDFLRQAIPAGTLRVMDTHDLVSDNAASRRREGIEVTEALGFAQELAFLEHYDRVLLIQPDDHARVAATLGARALCVPHPAELQARPVRPASRVIGYAASQAAANRHGLQWFATRVWPRLASAGATLDLAGPLSTLLPEPLPAGMQRRGVLPGADELWSGIDIAINPVRWGSGLKIKTVEALAAGLPLVTTREGARGLEEAAGQAFVLADDADTFAGACLTLLDDVAKRASLAAAAHAFARRRFTRAACFDELTAWLAGVACHR